jgi:hypothetical protein
MSLHEDDPQSMENLIFEEVPINDLTAWTDWVLSKQLSISVADLISGGMPQPIILVSTDNEVIDGQIIVGALKYIERETIIVVRVEVDNEATVRKLQAFLSLEAMEDGWLPDIVEDIFTYKQPDVFS